MSLICRIYSLLLSPSHNKYINLNIIWLIEKLCGYFGFLRPPECPAGEEGGRSMSASPGDTNCDVLRTERPLSSHTSL